MTVRALWAVRVFVLAAFAITAWFCGPRAVAVLAAKFGGEAQPGPTVQLDRVGFAVRPDWLTEPMLLSVAESVQPWLGHEVGILDEPSCRRLRDGLQTVAWVREVRVERVFPERFRLHMSLRRPLLAVHDADDKPLCLVDVDAVQMPWVESNLPKVLLYREGGDSTMDVVLGAACSAPRVRAAAGIVREWRDELAPLVPGCPSLLEIDTTNLGEQWIPGPEYPEVRVHLRRVDGQPVVFGYGRPVDTVFDRVRVATKAKVLTQILERHRGLAGLVAGDLRFSRRWAAYLQPRAQGVPDPNGPWKELVKGLLPEGR